MVYVMRAVSSATAVQAPAIVDRADAQPAPPSPAIGLSVCDLLACILRYFPTRFEVGK